MRVEAGVTLDCGGVKKAGRQQEYRMSRQEYAKLCERDRPEKELVEQDGYSAADLLQAGWQAARLRSAGWEQPRQLREAGLSAAQLKQAGWSEPKDLLDAGFTEAGDGAAEGPVEGRGGTRQLYDPLELLYDPGLERGRQLQRYHGWAALCLQAGYGLDQELMDDLQYQICDYMYTAHRYGHGPLIASAFFFDFSEAELLELGGQAVTSYALSVIWAVDCD